MNAIHPWKTISVVPLAVTWGNRYRLNDGRMIVDPCPAILVQERGGDTRTVFATYHRGFFSPPATCQGMKNRHVRVAGRRTGPMRRRGNYWTKKTRRNKQARRLSEDS